MLHNHGWFAVAGGRLVHVRLDLALAHGLVDVRRGAWRLGTGDVRQGTISETKDTAAPWSVPWILSGKAPIRANLRMTVRRVSPGVSRGTL